MELQTYGQCVKNKHLFKKFCDDDGGDGQFVRVFVGGNFRFLWFENCVYHRVGGPAVINSSQHEWWFMGEQVHGVKSQVEFEVWLLGKI